MAGDDKITNAGKKRMQRGCVFSVVFIGLGFYGGLTAAKKAIVGPDWARKITGITLPTPPPVVPSSVTPPASFPNGNQAPNYGNAQGSSQSPGSDPNAPKSGNLPDPPVTNPGSAGGNTGGPINNNTGPNTFGGSKTGNKVTTPAAVPPQNPPSGGWLVGQWEITDELHPTGSKSSTVTSNYFFDDGGTGEFDTNGKKLYDIHWEDATDYVLITFVTDAEGDQNLKVKMKYSVNADHTLLTLAPMGKKDPRGEMYSVGPGVYHRK